MCGVGGSVLSRNLGCVAYHCFSVNWSLVMLFLTAKFAGDVIEFKSNFTTAYGRRQLTTDCDSLRKLSIAYESRRHSNHHHKSHHHDNKGYHIRIAFLALRVFNCIVTMGLSIWTTG